MTFPHTSRGVITFDGDWRGNLQSVCVEWADVSMLAFWLQAQEARSKNQRLNHAFHKRLLHRDVLWGKWQQFRSRLMCSDNKKGSSNNLSTREQPSSMRPGLNTSPPSFFCCCTWQSWRQPPEFLWGSYPCAVPSENRSDSHTQLRDCQRKLLIKQMSFLPFAMRQVRRNNHALFRHTWRLWPNQENRRHTCPSLSLLHNRNQESDSSPPLPGSTKGGCGGQEMGSGDPPKRKVIVVTITSD